MAPAPGLRADQPAHLWYRRPAPSRRRIMWFFPWLSSRKTGAQSIPALASRRRRPAKRSPTRKLTLETLEDRTVPAAVNWVGGLDFSWENAANWSNDSVPGSAD